MGQNTIKKRTIGLIVFVVLIALIVGIFAAIAALQWWVATISALAVRMVIAVGMIAATQCSTKLAYSRAVLRGKRCPR
jgi:uncharacterized ion transporter superfamily protein YfcC